MDTNDRLIFGENLSTLSFVDLSIYPNMDLRVVVFCRLEEVV